jgi:hypothetical protein
MELNEVMKWLAEQNYATSHKGKWKFTSVFYKDMAGEAKGLIANTSMVLGTTTTNSLAELRSYVPGSVVSSAQWAKHYVNFIKACEVPSTGHTRNGTYAMNKYSDDGMKAFKKAIESGYKLEILVLAVTMYYRSNIGMKKAVGNYMGTNEWISDYQELIDNTTDSATLKKHLEKQKNAGRGTNYTRG